MIEGTELDLEGLCRSEECEGFGKRDLGCAVHGARMKGGGK